MITALGLLPAAHSKGLPSAVLVQHMLFKLVDSSRCHHRMISKGFPLPRFVLQTMSYAIMSALLLNKAGGYAHVASSGEREDLLFITLVCPRPEFDVVEGAF